MAYWVQETSTKQNMVNYRSYKCDYRSDINKLPRFGIKGELQENDTISAFPCSYGSECICIEDGSMWNLGKDTNEWVETQKNSQSTGAIQGTSGKDGVGIQNINKTNTNGLVDTYTITLSDSKTYNFTVTNGKNGLDGKGISSISKIATENRTDTYRITYTDDTHIDFTITNGNDGITPTISVNENGNWVINNTDTGVSAKGDKGEPGIGFQVNKLYNSIEDMLGDTDPVSDSSVVVVLTENLGNLYLRLSNYADPQGIIDGYLPMGGIADVTVVKGEKGDKGDSGLTPYIDAKTKHWFIGDTDTGVKAQGEDGKNGSATDIEVDAELSNTSENPVQNKVVKEAIDSNTEQITELSDKYDNVQLYQKYLNTELDYCYLVTPNKVLTLPNDIDKGDAIPFINIKEQAVNSEIVLNPNNNSVLLPAKKTYRISCWVTIFNGQSLTCSIKDISNNKIIGNLYSTNYSNDNSVTADEPECIYTPQSDAEIQVNISNFLGEVKIPNGKEARSRLIIQEINRHIVIDPVEYVNEESGIEDTPVGSIISHVGMNPPKHYLICDGGEYNISEYPHLAQHFRDEFGSIDHFGGDGVNTFNVPKLSKESEIYSPILYCIKYEPTYYFKNIKSAVEVLEDTDETFKLKFIDEKGNEEETPNLIGKQGIQGEKGDSGNDVIVEIDSQENYLYKLKFTDKDKEVITPNLKGMDGTTADIYSENETHIGTWIDGMPVYRKVIKYSAPAQSSSGQPNNMIELKIPHGITNLNQIVNWRLSKPENSLTYTTPYPNTAGVSGITQINSSYIVFRVIGDNWSAGIYLIIIEYTKKGDSPKILRPVSFPIGYVYMSVDPQNPGELFGGEWIPFGQGRMPIGINPDDKDFNEVEKTGGVKTQTLVAQIGATDTDPNRIGYSAVNKAGNYIYSYSLMGSNRINNTTSVNHATRVTDSTGNDNINNMPPYITIFMWKRVS